MRVLVTGGRGFIGSTCAAGSSRRVTDVVDSTTSAGRLDNCSTPELDLVEADLRDLDAVPRGARERVRRVLITRRGNGPEIRAKSEPGGVSPGNLVAESTCCLPRKERATVVFASSSSVYGDQGTSFRCARTWNRDHDRPTPRRSSLARRSCVPGGTPTASRPSRSVLQRVRTRSGSDERYAAVILGSRRPA